MREVVFLQKNASRWKEFERLLHEERHPDPDRLAELFVAITDDLSYARTFYPESETTAYLNGLAAEVHQAVYKNKKEERSRLVTFWTREVPRAVHGARRELVLSCAVFFLAMGLGILSAAEDTGFVRFILGDGYVNMTLANIEQGEPMAVYAQAQELDMFLAITFNNVKVAFYAFAAGILAAFGTAYVLFTNGVMLGAFHYLFYEQGFLLSSLLVVYIHGTLEIPAILLAGGAGFTMGKGILFPGAYTRRAAFMRGARRGLRIVIGLVPVFVAAGLLEGFVTRHTEMPLHLSVLIRGSLAFTVGYFVIYPFYIYKTASQHAD